MDILGALGSVFSGGLTGLLGIGIKAFTAYKTKKLEYEHEEKMQDLAMKSMQLEKEIAVEQSKMHIKETQVKVSGEALKTSYYDSQSENDILKNMLNVNYKERYGTILGGFFEFITLALVMLRTSVRPITTYYFEIFLTYIFIKVWTLTGGIKALSPDKIFNLLDLLINNLLFCGTTVILWWFGSRQIDSIFGKKK